jgi:hypothetical protein
VFTVPCIPLPIVNAEDNLGYSLGLRLTEECKAQIRNFRPSVIHFTVPDFLAMDALRWARAEVSHFWLGVVAFWLWGSWGAVVVFWMWWCWWWWRRGIGDGTKQTAHSFTRHTNQPHPPKS